MTVLLLQLNNIKLTKFENSVISFGALTQRSHPFSFRTRKLSSVVAMVLLCGRVARRQNLVLNLKNTRITRVFFVMSKELRLQLLCLTSHSILPRW